MHKLGYTIAAAKLPQHTHYRPKCHTVTRWSSTAAILFRYQNIKEFIPDLQIDEMIDLIPAPRKERTLARVLNQFQDFDSITKALQRSNITCSEVRVLFDGMIEKYPEIQSRLSPTTNILYDVAFESGIVKIQDQKMSQLTEDEKNAVGKMCASTANATVVEKDDCATFAGRFLKRGRIEPIEGTNIGTRFLTPTSNICERLFSKAGYALSDLRKKYHLRVSNNFFSTQTESFGISLTFQLFCSYSRDTLEI